MRSPTLNPISRLSPSTPKASKNIPNPGRVLDPKHGEAFVDDPRSSTAARGVSGPGVHEIEIGKATSTSSVYSSLIALLRHCKGRESRDKFSS